MIWIILAALGVPLWLVLGVLVGALLSRRSFRERPEVFKVKARLIDGWASEGVGASWPRSAAYACWVQNVLLVHQGLALVRTRALATSSAVGPPVAGDPGEVKRLGPQPTLLRVVLDDGATVELAAPGDDRDALVGPYGAVLV